MPARVTIKVSGRYPDGILGVSQGGFLGTWNDARGCPLRAEGVQRPATEGLAREWRIPRCIVAR
jgi:hypothetical protein